MNPSKHGKFQNRIFDRSTLHSSEPLHHQLEKNWMQEMEQKYLKTKNMVKSVCQTLNNTIRHWDCSLGTDVLGLGSPTPTELLLDSPHTLAACVNSKVGSTTWETHFYRLLPKEVLKNMERRFGPQASTAKRRFVRKNFLRHELAEFSDGFAVQSYSDWKEYTKKKQILTFSFVRHPFERLVSAYNYLVIENPRHIKTIVSGSPKLKEYWYKHDQSFSSFVDLIFTTYQMNFMNVHWEPLSYSCNFCEVEYDIIGRMETFADDVKYIIKRKN